MAGSLSNGSRSLPNPEVCQTRCMSEGISDCLVKDPWTCPYALRFGEGFFCQHPDAPRFERPPSSSSWDNA